MDGPRRCRDFCFGSGHKAHLGVSVQQPERSLRRTLTAPARHGVRRPVPSQPSIGRGGLEPERCGSPILFDRVKKLAFAVASFFCVLVKGAHKNKSGRPESYGASCYQGHYRKNQSAVNRGSSRRAVRGGRYERTTDAQSFADMELKRDRRHSRRDTGIGRQALPVRASHRSHP